MLFYIQVTVTDEHRSHAFTYPVLKNNYANNFHGNFFPFPAMNSSVFYHEQSGLCIPEESEDENLVSESDEYNTEKDLRGSGDRTKGKVRSIH